MIIPKVVVRQIVQRVKIHEKSLRTENIFNKWTNIQELTQISSTLYLSNMLGNINERINRLYPFCGVSVFVMLVLCLHVFDFIYYVCYGK